MEESRDEHTTMIPSRLLRRMHALFIGMGALAVLAIAGWLSPAQAGVGTHQQLGLPQCGWIVAADLPCPTCGMTTAFSYTVRGKFVSAIKSQPFGMLLAICVAITGILGLSIAITGRPHTHFWYRWLTTKTLFIFVGLAAFAWVYKILAHRGWFL